MSEAANPRFVHLRVNTIYSPLEGALRIPELVALCRQYRMPAVGITDSGNLFGALEFSTSAARAGIQPVIGCAIGLRTDSQVPPGPVAGPAPALLLFAQSATGYGNLMRLASNLQEGVGSTATSVDMEGLQAASAELICLTGGPFGPLGRLLQDGREDAAAELARALATVFPGRLYVELQRHGTGARRATAAESATEPGLLQLAHQHALPLVATNEACFPDRAFFEAHEVLLQIRPAASRTGVPSERYTPEHYFAPPEEMCARFADLPEALANSVEIARRCAFAPQPAEARLPQFAEDEMEVLRRDARQGLELRLQESGLAAGAGEYTERLDYELGVIESMQFAGYFLIVAEFVKWARDAGIPVGPGRGSGAGSLVAYSLRITDLDPLRYGLLFERFLNPERISMPDFDIDLCERRRDEVLRHLQERYGADRVAKIISLGSLKSRAAIRDVGRALGLGYGQTDRIAKLIPMHENQPLPLLLAREQVQEFRDAVEADARTRRLFEIATRIEGLPRNPTIHAAGVVIANRPVTELVPLYRDSRADMPATQFTKEWVEAAGLVKFDLLGLKTLTAIEEAVNFLTRRGVALDIARIPLDDAKTFALYRSADTTGVFQVESAGMRSALIEMQPDRFEDLIALVALYRPGPMENIHKFCAIKRGLEQAEVHHPKIEAILRETYGIIVYQEQIMEIARTLADFSLAQADILRRAIGKKNPEEMKGQKADFLKGLRETSGLKAGEALRIYELIEKFASYGFNKSHAAAYALVSYQTAYLKANYPAEFIAAAMNTEIGGHAQDRKLAAFRQEARRRGVEVPPPDVNHSGARFHPDGNRIPYALGAVKGVGVTAVGPIREEREANGPFSDLFDFAKRVDLSGIGRGALEQLANAGALDSVEPNRARALAAVDTLMRYAKDCRAGAASAMASLFGTEEEMIAPPPLPAVAELPPSRRYALERTAVGFLVSGHPLDAYGEDLRVRGIRYGSELAAGEADGKDHLVVGLLVSVERRRTRRGGIFARLQLSDPLENCSVTMFSRELEQCGNLLQEGEIVVLTVTAEPAGKTRQGGLICRHVRSLEDALNLRRNGRPEVLRLRIAAASATGAVAALLADANRDEAAGRAEIRLVLDLPDAESQVEMVLPGEHPLTVRSRSDLAALPGVLELQVAQPSRADVAS